MSPLPTERPHFQSRQPAVPVAVCFAAGILLDRSITQLTWWTWSLAAVVAVGFAIAGWLRTHSRMVVISLLACGVCLGGLRHHAFWSLSSLEDVSRFVRLESRLIRLRGRVMEPPLVRPPSEEPYQSVLPPEAATILTVNCQSLKDGTRFVPVQGKAQVRVSGYLPDLKQGDAIEVSGWISKPFPTANPGDFDFGEYLKQQEIGCIVRVQEPEAVLRIASHEHPRIDLVRSRAEGILNSHLSEQNAKIAAALLLGIRSTLPEDLRDAFAQSGMMHVLALSGLHVGILAGLVWLVCRLLCLSPRKATLLTMAAVLALAVVSGGRPPIVRATVFLGIASLGRLAARQSHPNNILAIAALVILAWNPSDLFDVGTQLSFLAVMGILMTTRWGAPQFDRNQLALDESQLEDRLHQILGGVARVLWRYVCLMLGIWLLTGPLIAAQFHLISPIGMLLNSFLIPLVVLVLWSGYLLLLIGWLFPPVAVLFAVPLDAGLTFLLGVVKWGAGVRLGHLYVAGPPNWWLAGYYLLWAGFYVFRSRMARPRFAGGLLLLGWTAFGLGIAAWPTSPQGLRATFLSVGHGSCSAILVEFPNGKTLLFDAGALDDGQRAFRVIRTALWQRGITRLDAVALSHADLDHVNAIPQLAREIPVGTLLVARSFFQSPQAVVPYLIGQVKERGIPIRAIGQDDRLAFDPSVTVEVKHPDPKTSYSHSNANSLAIRFTHAGRSLLLVGDVELEGLNDLMAHDPGQVDVLQSPHHGSRTANTPELVKWANPRIVVVSGGYVPGRMQELATVYGSSARLLSTFHNGAVTVDITSTGQLLVKSHVESD